MHTFSPLQKGVGLGVPEAQKLLDESERTYSQIVCSILSYRRSVERSRALLEQSAEARRTRHKIQSMA